MPSLGRWLAGKFGPGALPQTVRELQDAQEAGGDHAGSEQARREIAECDAKLRAHRAALEAGADPAIVAAWTAEVQAQHTVAEARLRQGSDRQRMTAEEITHVVASLRDLMGVLAAADPADKAQIYCPCT